MGTSISHWDGATAYFLFAHSPSALVLFALGVFIIGFGLITTIKRHEDKTFTKHLADISKRTDTLSP